MADSSDAEPNVPDYELRPPGEIPSTPQARGPWGAWLVAIGLITAIAISAYVIVGRRTTSPPVTTERERVDATQQPVQPLGGDAASIVLPPLDQTDALVRELVKQMTSHPHVTAWLATRGLIRNFVIVVSLVADGKTPARQLPGLRPSGRLGVVERGDELYLDPRSYERYDGFAAATASIDPAGAARLYTMLKPRIEEAYRELGMPDTPFDRTLERAIVVLLETPVVDSPTRVKPMGGVGHGFAASDLEARPAAQKQLLRMGPQNTRTIQTSLRAIALALGIPTERLPASGR